MLSVSREAKSNGIGLGLSTVVFENICKQLFLGVGKSLKDRLVICLGYGYKFLKSQ